MHNENETHTEPPSSEKSNIDNQKEIHEQNEVGVNIKEIFEAMESFALKNGLSLHHKSSDGSDTWWYSEIKKWPLSPDDNLSGAQLRLRLNVQLEGGHGWISFSLLHLYCSKQQRQWIEDGTFDEPWENIAMAVDSTFPEGGHNKTNTFFNFDERKEGDNIQTEGVDTVQLFLDKNKSSALMWNAIETELMKVMTEWQKI